MKNIPLSTVCRGQYVIVLSNHLYIGRVTDTAGHANLSIDTIWSNAPAKGRIIHSNFCYDIRNFTIIYKSSFPLDYTDLTDILKDHPELLI